MAKFLVSYIVEVPDARKADMGDMTQVAEDLASVGRPSVQPYSFKLESVSVYECQKVEKEP